MRFDAQIFGFDARFERVKRIVNINVNARRLQNRIAHRHARKRRREVNRVFAVRDLQRAARGSRAFHKNIFHHLHHARQIAERLIALHHRKFGQMRRVHAFVAKIFRDFVHALVHADEQAFQIQFVRNAQIQIAFEFIVVRHKRFRQRAAVQRLKHRRFHFDKIVAVEIRAHRRDNALARAKHRAHIFVHHQIEIALAIARFLVRQAVKFFRHRRDRFGEQHERGNLHRKFARFRFEQCARRLHKIAEVIIFEKILVRFFAEIVLTQKELNASRAIAYIRKRNFACPAIRGHASDECHRAGVLTAFRHFAHLRNHVRARRARRIRVNAAFAQALRFQIPFTFQIVERVNEFHESILDL